MRENFVDEDVAFFREHPTRQLHIRHARSGERADEFARLGFHLTERRRILVWKAPPGGFGAGEILRIPFLQFADESIADTDAMLLPILHQVMLDGAEDHKMPLPKMKRR